MSITDGLQPMTEAELDQLEAILQRPAFVENGMSLEILDGFFSALMVAPELVMPGEYLPYVWGGPAPWQDPAEAAEAASAVMRLWNHVAWRVQQPVEEAGDPETQALLIPFMVLPEEDGGAADADDPLAGVPADFPFAAGWAHGFLLGVSLRPEAWDALVRGNEDLMDDMSMLVSLSVIDAGHAQEMGLPAEVLMDLEERMAVAAELPGMLYDLNLLRLHTAVRTPIRREPVPGRNAACPCGSGKKFKKCCGASSPLH